MKIIGFAGKKGVGKNFVSDCAVEVLLRKQKKVSTYAFANPLKEFCIKVLGVDRAAAYGNDFDKNAETHYKWADRPDFIRSKNVKNDETMTVRHVLQIFGTEVIRDIWDKQAWINTMVREAKEKEAQNYDYFFVTDVRFENEVDGILDIGTILYIDGPQRGNDNEKNDKHSSETYLDRIKERASSDSRIVVFNNDLSCTKQDIESRLSEMMG